MSDFNDGGPAFPAATEHGCNSGRLGMTLRDYMAIHASESDILAQSHVIRHTHLVDGRPGILPDNWIPVARYMHADAMLKAREVQA